MGRGDMPVGDALPPDAPGAAAFARIPSRRATCRSGAISARARDASRCLHALAHIELNAIDLAWDIVARFAANGLPREFFDDWVGVAAEEAEHFLLLSARLADFGARYGDLPAHDGLWEAAARDRRRSARPPRRRAAGAGGART